MSEARAGRIEAPWLGVVLFIFSEVMLFGALFAGYFALRGAAAEWPPAGTPEVELALPAVMTAVLAASSLTQHAAAARAGAGRLRAARRLMLATALLGLAFAAGQAYEFASTEMTPAHGTFATLFFTITAFHGLHVLGGVAGVLAARASAEDRGIVEAATAYWHFVDVVWVAVFTILYVAP